MQSNHFNINEPVFLRKSSTMVKNEMTFDAEVYRI